MGLFKRKYRLIGFRKSFKKWSNYGVYYICSVEIVKYLGLYKSKKNITVFWSEADMIMKDPEEYYKAKLNIWYTK